MFVNETSSDTDITITDYSEIEIEWYSNPSVNVDTCILELNNGTDKINYTGTASTNYCNVTISEIKGINYTYIGWANNSDNTWDSTDEYWAYVNLDPTGYWIMRAPVNSTNIYTGDSKARRYGGEGAPLGNGRDVGVMWRNDTLDEEGRLHGEIDTDEERHCGAWTQFYFDEIGYDNGTIENLYCHMWMYTEDTINDYGGGSGQPVVGVGINGEYTSGSYYDLDNFYHTPAYPQNATKYNLQIYWKENLNLGYNDDYNFTGISFKGSGSLVQMMSYRNQRSFCVVNVNTTSWETDDTDGDGLTDFEEFNNTYTDPYNTDTDNDGHNDYQEWENGKSGIDPYDWGTIKIIKLDGEKNKAFVRERNNQTTYLPPAKYTDTLDREFTSAEYANLTYHDSNCPFQQDCTNATVFEYTSNVTAPYSHTQINFYYNISEEVSNLSNIINLNMFYGGIIISIDNVGGQNMNKSLTIANFNNSDNFSILQSKPGHTNAFYMKQLNESIQDYVNETTGLLWSRAETSSARSNSDLTFGWSELWIITGTSVLNITEPRNETFKTINDSDILFFNFTFQEQGVPIISGVTIDNIEIEGVSCVSGGAPIYEDEVWKANCTVPCIETSGEYYNLSLTASTSFLTLETTNEDAVFYESHGACDSCTYSGSGDWFINCADNCLIDTNTDLRNNVLRLFGSGTLNVQSDIYMSGITKEYDCSIVINKVLGRLIGFR